MGRPQAFTTMVVVAAARDVFWERGYDNTALPDLEAATGLHRSSLYNTFGSKRGLFDAVIDNYLAGSVHPLLHDLRTVRVRPGSLDTYLSALHALIADPGSLLARHGCLLVNRRINTHGR